MKKTIGFVLLAALLLATAAFASEEKSFNGYIVRMAQEQPALFSDGEGAFARLAPKLYKVDDPALVEELLESGAAVSAEPNYIVELFDFELFEVDTSVSWTDVLMQSDYAAELGLDGTGVRVAVIDSGVQTDNLNLQNANIVAGYDYVEDSADTMSDDIGHGTKVIQMIVGDGDGMAVRGVAPGATLVPFRCFYKNEEGIGVAQTADLLQAIYDAVDTYDCDVINLSWGFSSSSEELLAAVQYVNDKGAVLVAAAGNVTAAMPQGTLSYPAAYDASVGVGSVDSTLTVASTSQQTEAVYACAPGAGVIFYNTSDQLVSSGGTSFAAPCVAGAASLLKQLQPSLTTAAFRELLAARAVDLGEAGYDTAYGHGFVQMDALLGKSWLFDAETSAIGWLRNDGSSLVKALYNADGRFTRSTFARTEEKIAAISHEFTSGAKESLFLWDESSVPLVGAVKR